MIKILLINSIDHVLIIKLAAIFLKFLISERRHTKFASESKENFEKLQVIKNFNRSFTRCQSIISHKEMLNALEYAADVNKIIFYIKDYNQNLYKRYYF